MRDRGRATVIGASLSVLALVISGCGRADGIEPAPPTVSSSSAHPGSAPAEPEYETNLKLSAEERMAADGAYDVLDKFTRAYNSVASSGYENGESALRYAGGEFRQAYEEGFAEARDSGETAEGAVTHAYHKLTELDIDNAGGGDALFESCVDYSNFDMFDSDGQSLKAEGLEPFIAHYSLRMTDGNWLIVEAERTGDECEE